jgi:hypothetical protein
MNTKLLSALTATAAATALFGAAAPAHAFSFGTNGILFENDTPVTFEFKQTYGLFTSSLGVYSVSGGTPTLLKTLFSEVKPSDDGGANNYKGTLGNTVLGSGVETFTFLANQIYTLGLKSVLGDGSDRGTVFSTSALNVKSGGTQQALFFNPNGLLPQIVNASDNAGFAGNPANFSSGSSLFTGTTGISFDDRGNANDADFQDFTVTASAVPEPMTMTGLALGLGGLVAARRRRRGSNTGS